MEVPSLLDDEKILRKLITTYPDDFLLLLQTLPTEQVEKVVTTLVASIPIVMTIGGSSIVQADKELLRFLVRQAKITRILNMSFSSLSLFYAQEIAIKWEEFILLLDAHKPGHELLAFIAEQMARSTMCGKRFHVVAQLSKELQHYLLAKVADCSTKGIYKYESTGSDILRELMLTIDYDPEFEFLALRKTGHAFIQTKLAKLSPNSSELRPPSFYKRRQRALSSPEGIYQ